MAEENGLAVLQECRDPDPSIEYAALVTESVMSQKLASRLMYTLQTEGYGALQVEDMRRIRGLLENINSILRVAIKDYDKSADIEGKW
ncbi:MAG: hypothetical protein ACW99G_19275 [Candidatus Thorarchaeota archaeon]